MIPEVSSTWLNGDMCQFHRREIFPGLSSKKEKMIKEKDEERLEKTQDNPDLYRVPTGMGWRMAFEGSGRCFQFRIGISRFGD